MILKSGFERSEKCRWYQLVDEFMHDRTNVVTHAHANTVSPDGSKCTTTLEANTMEQRSGESTSKSPEPKRKDGILIRECISEIRESNRKFMKNMKASDDLKMTLNAANYTEIGREDVGTFVVTQCPLRKFPQCKPLS